MKSVWSLSVFLLSVFAVGLLAGCEGMPNETLEKQQKQRLDQGVPGPTELPPGLSADLPAKPIQPLAKDN